MIGMKGSDIFMKKEFKDNCCRCAKAWNCYTRDNCQFVEMDISAWSKEDDDENNAFLAYASSL